MHIGETRGTHGPYAFPFREPGTPATLGRTQHEPDIAIGNANGSVVARHHDGAPLVPLARKLDESVPDKFLFDGFIHIHHAPGPLTHGAKHAASVELPQQFANPGLEVRGHRRTRLQQRSVGCETAGRRDFRHHLSGRRRCQTTRRRVVGESGLYRCTVPSIDGRGQSPDGLGETSATLQRHHAGTQWRTGRSRAQIRQHGARLHALELVRVAKQHQHGGGGQRRKDGVHHFQIDHRGFVDKQHVAVDGMPGIVLERAGTGAGPQQAMHRLGGWQTFRAYRRRQGFPELMREFTQRLGDGLVEATGSLACGGCEGDTQPSAARRLLQQLQQGIEPRRRIRLAGARPASDEHQLAIQACPAGQALPVRFPFGRRKQTRQPVVLQCQLCRRPHGNCARAKEQVPCYSLLAIPEAAQIKPAVTPDQRSHFRSSRRKQFG